MPVVGARKMSSNSKKCSSLSIGAMNQFDRIRRPHLSTAPIFLSLCCY
jgi:hypothetical protein